MSETDVPPTLEYQSAPIDERAKKLLNLAVILNFVSMVIDGVCVVLWLGMFVVFGIGQAPDRAELMIMSGVYTLLSLVIGALKFEGTFKVIRKHSAGWGLAVGIIGCLNAAMLWMGAISVPIGIFTIVVFSQSRVRVFLAERRVRARR